MLNWVGARVGDDRGRFGNDCDVAQHRLQPLSGLGKPRRSGSRRLPLHRDLDRVDAIGVDEIQWQRGHHYLTLVYQIDGTCRRLLWIGQERTVLPLLAEVEFGLTAFTATLTFIAAFGTVKAATNFFAGTLSDRYGRKPVLVAGRIISIPVPLLLIWAPTWEWIIFAKRLVGHQPGADLVCDGDLDLVRVSRRSAPVHHAG